METAKHTPGPWKANGYLVQGKAVLFDGRELLEAIIASTTPNDWQEHGGPTYDECRENARLIAAAPETAAERDRLKVQRDELVAAAEDAIEATALVVKELTKVMKREDSMRDRRIKAERTSAELLAAAEGVLGVLNHGTPNPHSRHIDIIRAAIARAKGE